MNETHEYDNVDRMNSLLHPSDNAQPKRLASGNQMMADLFHAAHCSQCNELLGMFLQQCRDHSMSWDNAQGMWNRVHPTESASKDYVAGWFRGLKEIAPHD